MDSQSYSAAFEVAESEFELGGYGLQNYCLAAVDSLADAFCKCDDSRFVNRLARFESALYRATKLFNDLPDSDRIRIDGYRVGVPGRKLFGLLHDVAQLINSTKIDDLNQENLRRSLSENGLPFRPNDYLSIVEEVGAIEFDPKKSLREKFIEAAAAKPGSKTVGESVIPDDVWAALVRAAERTKQLNRDLAGDGDDSNYRALIELVQETGLSVAELNEMSADDFEQFQLAAIRRRDKAKIQLSLPEAFEVIKWQSDQAEANRRRFLRDTGVEPVNEPQQWIAWGVELFGPDVVKLRWEQVADLIWGKLSKDRTRTMPAGPSLADSNLTPDDGAGKQETVGCLPSDRNSRRDEYDSVLPASDSRQLADRISRLIETLRDNSGREFWNVLEREQNDLANNVSELFPSLPKVNCRPFWVECIRVDGVELKQCRLEGPHVGTINLGCGDDPDGDHESRVKNVLSRWREWLLRIGDRDGRENMIAKPVDDVQQSALSAVIDAGLVVVLGVADNAPSRNKISEIMRSMLAADSERYWWSADRWIVELGKIKIRCSKRTIIGNQKQGVPPCPAWVEILAWRESNKQNRFPKKPEKKI